MRPTALAAILALLLSPAVYADGAEQSAKEGFREIHKGMKKVTKGVHKQAKKDTRKIDREAKKGWKQAGKDVKEATRD